MLYKDCHVWTSRPFEVTKDKMAHSAPIHVARCFVLAHNIKCFSSLLQLALLNSLPISRTLGALAEKCHAYAKALHYKELEFKTSPELCVEALISINNQLRQPEAAIGILTYAQQTLHMELKVTYHRASLLWGLQKLRSTAVQTRTTAHEVLSHERIAP